MSVPTIVSILLFYPLVLLGDGCLLIAIAVASTTQGHAWLWGVSFAGFHALYGILGIALVSEVTHYSEMLGEVFMLGGSLFLLWHFVHHRLHHRVRHDCRCENHPPRTVSSLAVVSSAAALSLHSLAGGAIIKGWVPDVSNATLIGLLIAASCILGLLSFSIVRVGELEHQPILRFLDKLPGIVGIILSGACFGVLYHLLEEWISPSPIALGSFIVIAFIASGLVGYSVQGKGTSSIVQIGPRK